MLTPDFKYAVFFDSEGKFESANLVATGATVYVRNSPDYDPATNPLTAAFMGMNYDTSDRPLLLPEAPIPDASESP